MALAFILAWLVQNVRVVGYDDDDVSERMWQREVFLREQMTRLLQEIEQRSMEWSFLWAVLHYWRLCLCIGLFFSLFWNLWEILQIILHDNWWENEGQQQQQQQLEEVQQQQPLEGQQQQPLEGQQQQPGEQQLEWEQLGEENEQDVGDRAWTRYVAQRALEKLRGRAGTCMLVEHVMNGLLQVFRTLCSGSSFPVLQPVIGVGSAFEGWSPRDEDIVYRLLVPMEAPHGHLFHLELGSDGEVLARNSRIRVELQCTCTSEQQGAELLCFLHHSEEELSRNQDPSLLDTLCTGSYLDAQKTASWFRELVVAVWAATPQAHGHRLRLLPSSRSCKLQLTDISSGEKLLVELLFGVRQEDSDIFLSSHNTDAGFTASTAWPQSCAVAEKKFFQYVARNVPEGSTHLNCLGLFAHILVGIGFSTYAIKTVVMHLLTTIPVWSWSEMDFLCRLDDILRYLHCCLQEKRLTHFLLGNETVPEEVVLPQAFQTASPLNLFQHLEREPAAHSQALEEFRQMRSRLSRLLTHGR